MATSPIDLSAGLQPARPAGAPAIDLSAGLTPASSSASSTTAPSLGSRIVQGAKATAQAAADPLLGAGEGVIEAGKTLAQWTHDLGEKIHQGLGEKYIPQDGIDELAKAATPDNGEQMLGKGAEGVAEFLLGDGALKGLSLSEKLAKVAPVVARLEKSPTLLKVAQSAIRSGTVAGGQAKLHGGSNSEAGLDAAIGAVTGGAGEGVGELYGRIKPGTTKIGSVEMPELASQRPGGSTLGDSTAANTPSVAKAQQKGAQQVVENNAQDATRGAIDRLNKARGAVNAPELVDQAPSSFELSRNDAALGEGEEQAKPPIWQQSTGASALRTSSPSEAMSWISRLNDIEEMGGLTDAEKAARDRLQAQVDMHHAASSAAKYLDPNEVASQVRTYGEAADQIKGAAKPIFQKLDEVSGGRFGALRKMASNGMRAIQDANSDEALAAAHAQVDDANTAMDELFTRHAGEISPEEYRAAKTAWHDASTLERVHRTVEGQFNGISPDIAARSAQDGGRALERVLSNPSTKRLGALERSVGLGRLDAVLGRDGLTNLQRVNQLLEGEKRPQAFQYILHAAHYAGRGGGAALVGAAAAHATGHNPYEGGAAGLLAGIGGRAVLRQMATNPRLAQMVEYAAKNGVPRGVAIPLIAGTMSNTARVATGQGTKENQ